MLRQDPDVIMIGEMRDAVSIGTAMTAAETGHLVLSTLHTNSAAQTIDRIIDSFPAEQQGQVTSQLAATLVAIVSERLLPRISGGRIPAMEIMIVNPAIRNLIRERKTYQIDLVIETSLQEGMVTLNRSLVNLVKNKEITLENAELYSLNPAELRILCASSRHCHVARHLMKFKYQAKNKRRGNAGRVTLKRTDRDNAATILASHELFVLSLEADETPSFLIPLPTFFARARRKDFIVFARQLATLLEARLPLNNALKILRAADHQPETQRSHAAR